MMMVVTMMEVGLHLDLKLSKLPGACQPSPREKLAKSMKLAHNVAMPPRVFATALLMVSLFFAGLTLLAETKSAGPVDINHAAVAEIEKVPGMTAVWAARIVRFRPYRAKSDLVEKGIVPAEVYARIRDGIVARKNE